MADAPRLTLEQAIYETIREPLLVLDGELRVVSVNASFLRTFGVSSAETEGQFIYDLGNGQWDIPALRQLLEEIVPRHSSIESFEVDHAFPLIGRRIMLLNARRIVDTYNGQSRLLLAIEDITQRRKLEQEKDELLHRQELLLEEMTHRVNNSLSIVASILLMKAKTVQSDETRQHLHDAHGRIMAVARVQGQLRPAAYGDQIVVKSYLERLTRSLAEAMILDGQPVTIRVDAEAGMLSSQRAVAVGLIATELIINSLKHAFPIGAAGEIVVRYEVTDTMWRLTVADDGIGHSQALANAPRSGLGTNILDALCRQLGGRITTSLQSPGWVVSVTAPVIPIRQI